ncbi:MAG: flavin-dependent dehydrogenase [Bacteroidia bacterium]|jgi:flavin-dependent dehydrogenase
MSDQKDVVILGGGLAGLTLSLQLKNENPDIKVVVLEKRESAADEAAFKVGESTVELATHYLREVLGLKDYLDENQLPKHGLRFFISPKHKDQIHRRVELGPKGFLPVPSHQIDRGIFENDLIQICLDKGIDVRLGAKVEAADLDVNGHKVSFSQGGSTFDFNAKWVVDASGRASFLKRKLGFAEAFEHNVNSAWFRVDYKIDIDTWSDNEHWHSHVDNDLRYLSTIHLMDTGYWVWIIPLVGGRTSVGIVADESIHPFASYNSLEKSLDWINENEPQFGKELEPLKDKILDFKVMKHFAHASKESFSTDRWTVTGESGFFADPFYSPGSDFISMANTWTSDLIQRDLKGEDVFFRTKMYAQTFKALYENWMPLYKDMYPLWGKSQVMVAKIFWDWGAYWSINTLIFMNDGLTNIELMKQLTNGPTAFFQRYGELSGRMQNLFKQWGPHDTADISDRYTDPFDLDFLKKFQEDIVEKQINSEELKIKLFHNLELLESIAAETFRLVSNQVYGTAMNIDVDPYTMTLDEANKAESRNSKMVGRDAHVTQELKHMWLYPHPEEAIV